MNNITNKFRLTIIMLVMLFAGTAKAQSTFSYLTAYDTITNTPDTLHWFIPAPAANAFGTATMTVYYEGDFGSSSEDISIISEDGIELGVTRSYFDGSDCMADSVTFTFSASQVNSWAADDTLWFTGITSPDVDLFCTANHAQLLLTYSYCLTGPVAALSAPLSSTCSSAGIVTLNGAPSGGTYSGEGVSGNTFDPQGLAPGSYTLTYTYTNAGGCTSSDFTEITINEGPVASALTDTICTGSSATLDVNGTGHLVWYSDAALTMPVGTGSAYVTPALSATTTYYAATVLRDPYFMVNGISVADSVVIDHDTITGDDRGGIAVTNNYIYMVGDNFTGRFDLNLGNAMSFPRRDALLSDLKTGQLYTLYNPSVGFPDEDSMGYVNITQLRTLNDDLTLGSGILTLSDSIPFGYDTLSSYRSGIFAGNGFTIIYSALSRMWYVIDMQDGVVTNLGTLQDPDMNSAEAWASYGVAEFDGTAYSVLYRYAGNSDINRRVLPDNTPVTAYSFSNISDMASFTYAPWNNRLYMHYEGSGEFGGDSETLLYITAADSASTTDIGAAHLNCSASVTVTVDLCTDVKELGTAAMNIYPNPNNGVFTIVFSENMSNSKVEIISMEGRLVYAETLKGASTKDIDLSAFAKGMYYVRISNDTAVLTQKLVKY